MNYALFPGGKRFRPVLTLLGAEIVGGERENVLPAAVAVEFVHTSALIFDDLPCMDNASERRGKAALHTKYGEGMAVLVALALLNNSYGLIFGCGEVDESLLIRAHSELVECIGASGMVAGQTVDLAAASGPGLFSKVSRDEFESARNLKTTALMRTSLRVGAILSGASEEQLKALSRFADLIGNAYQTSDDLIDIHEDAALANGILRRETLTLEIGVKDAKKRIVDFVTQAKEVLITEYGPIKPVNILCEMADYITERES
jgi:geranylgeranyl diphosphate synthase type II